LFPATDAAQIDLLIEGRADFAFSVRTNDDPRIGHELYGEEEIVLVGAPGIAERITQNGDLAAGLAATPYLTYDIQRSVVLDWLEHNEIDVLLGQEAIVAPDLRALRNPRTARAKALLA
jgi:hypothetical protein